MTKLKLGPITEDKPVRVTIVAYAEELGRETGKPATDPKKLIVPMLERFMATDRAFAKALKGFLPLRQTG